MTEDLKQILPSDFADDSKVWIYQCNRAFNEQEILEINEQLEQFYMQWQSHGAPVKGWAKLMFGQFVVVMADEKATGVSGCSTDSSVRIIKSIERQYNVNMFDRNMLTFLIKEKAEMLPLNQVKYAMDNGFLTRDSVFFNNLVATKADLLDSWLVAIKDSWLDKRIAG